MCLTGTRRTDQQNVGGRVQVAAGGELVDELAVHPGGGVDVETVQGGGGGQAGEPQPASQAAGLIGVDLNGQQPLQRHGQRQSLGGGLVDHGGQGFGGGVQFQRGQMRPQPLIAAGSLGGGRCGQGGVGGAHFRVLLRWAARS